MIDQELLNILACPECKSDVDLKDNKIICKGCGRKYPVMDGIPIMLIEESEPPKEEIK
ncbi:MAG: Trm112 family protein [Candidatus Omnitrophota bacterium]